MAFFNNNPGNIFYYLSVEMLSDRLPFCHTLIRSNIIFIENGGEENTALLMFNN
jgi:hypothetical protein